MKKIIFHLSKEGIALLKNLMKNLYDYLFFKMNACKDSSLKKEESVVKKRGDKKMIGGIVKVAKENIKDSEKEKGNGWNQVIEINRDKKIINYYAYIAYPICEVYDETGKRVYDEYKYRTGKRLEERGWKRGIGLIYKEKIPFTEILDCIAFIKAYRESYEFLTETGGPFINVPITVESFLELVDVKTKIERECGPLPAEMTWKNLEPFLFRTMGFKLVSFEEENK